MKTQIVLSKLPKLPFLFFGFAICGLVCAHCAKATDFEDLAPRFPSLIKSAKQGDAKALADLAEIALRGDEKLNGDTALAYALFTESFVRGNGAARAKMEELETKVADSKSQAAVIGKTRQLRKAITSFAALMESFISRRPKPAVAAFRGDAGAFAELGDQLLLSENENERTGFAALTAYSIGEAMGDSKAGAKRKEAAKTALFGERLAAEEVAAKFKGADAGSIGALLPILASEESLVGYREEFGVE